MNKFLVMGLIAMAALVGCKKSEPGGPGRDETFRLVVPAMDVDVKQGEVKTARISVDRSSEFKQAVMLEIKAPAGLKIDPDKTTVKPSDKGDVQLTITAAKDATLGSQLVLVKGTPESGDSTTTQFTVKVAAP